MQYAITELGMEWGGIGERVLVILISLMVSAKKEKYLDKNLIKRK